MYSCRGPGQMNKAYNETVGSLRGGFTLPKALYLLQFVLELQNLKDKLVFMAIFY